MKPGVPAVVLGLTLAVSTAAAGSGPKTLRARLMPIILPSAASGAFTARVVQEHNAVLLRWQLTLAHLSGPATRTTVRTGRGRSVAFTLCAPCASRATGRLVVTPSAWRTIIAKRTDIVVRTLAHPKGELRGTLAP